MALYFYTREPKTLLASFRDKIETGAIVTWEEDEDGDFTHTARQWDRKAWLRPKFEDGRLAFYILYPKGAWISTAIYAIYHGRFIESMLRHCDDLFSNAAASAYPEGEDKVRDPAIPD